MRRGFTTLEVTVAMAVLALAAVLIAQTAVWSLAERANAENRLAVSEWTVNVLEQARARQWADLTPAWASSMKLPDDVAARLNQVNVTVTVADEPGVNRVKRVTATVVWKNADGSPTPAVTMATLFAEGGR